MIVTRSSDPQNSGIQGISLLAEAEKLEAILWSDVLSAMTKSAIPAGSLGTGSHLYNDIATRAVAGRLFGNTDAGLTQEIVAQLEGNAAGTHPKDRAVDVTSGVSTVAALSAMAGSGSTPQISQGILSRAASYAKSIWPAIKAGASALDVPPEALLAQSALETGWGASTPGNNLFGVKAVAGQAANIEPTNEEQGGVLQPTHAAFAAYASPEAAIGHFVSLIQRAYKNAAGAMSVAQYASALANGGYATDPAYAEKIVGVAQSPLMQSVLQLIEGTTQ